MGLINSKGAGAICEVLTILTLCWSYTVILSTFIAAIVGIRKYSHDQIMVIRDQQTKVLIIGGIIDMILIPFTTIELTYDIPLIPVYWCFYVTLFAVNIYLILGAVYFLHLYVKVKRAGTVKIYIFCINIQ